MLDRRTLDFPGYVADDGLERDTSAARATITAIADARSSQIIETSLPTKIIINYVASGSVNTALEPLRMAKKLDPYRETARMAIGPWLVETALARLGERRLTADEQQKVVKATRTAWKVNWPDWWEVGP